MQWVFVAQKKNNTCTTLLQLLNSNEWSQREFSSVSFELKCSGSLWLRPLRRLCNHTGNCLRIQLDHKSARTTLMYRICRNHFPSCNLHVSHNFLGNWGRAGSLVIPNLSNSVIWTSKACGLFADWHGLITALQHCSGQDESSECDLRQSPSRWCASRGGS